MILASAVAGCALIARQYVEPVGGRLAYFDVEDVNGNAIFPSTFAKAENCTGRLLVASPGGNGFGMASAILPIQGRRIAIRTGSPIFRIARPNRSTLSFET